MKNKKSVFVMGMLFTFAWGCMAVLLGLVFYYRAQNAALKQLMDAVQRDKNESQVQAELVRHFKEGEAEFARRSVDFLAWKQMLTEELRGTNARFSESVRGVKDLKNRKELANILYYTLGLTYTAGSDFTAAKQSFSQALRYDPSDGESWYNLGLLHSFSDASFDRKKSSEYFRKYLEVVPGGRRTEAVRKKLGIVPDADTQKP